MWYFSERIDNGGDFDSIPSAWYFGSIFLLSEWCSVDFSFAGKLLCIVYCLIGVALFSIFTGAVYEALGDSLTDFAEAKEKIDYSKLKKDFIREHREYFFGKDEEDESVSEKPKKSRGTRKEVTLVLEPETMEVAGRREVD